MFIESLKDYPFEIEHNFCSNCGLTVNQNAIVYDTKLPESHKFIVLHPICAMALANRLTIDYWKNRREIPELNSIFLNFL